MQFNQFDPAAFLRDYWQKQPLLIRNPWRQWTNPLEPDELAGLALEDGVESRLVVHGAAGLTLEHGPFGEDRFERLGETPWTLLVQAVDQHDPAVAALIEPFRFIPSWRIDDVMVSYASDGGGVGPHFDQYDVFLVQGAGRRRWQVGPLCDANTPLLPHPDLRLLAEFEPSGEWILEPGDILYLPPGLAHNGVAIGDGCMTYSVGFRAPARSELIAQWCDHVLAAEADDIHYRDPDLALQANPGEITPAALAELQRLTVERLLDPASFARWFGQYNTTPKYPEIDWSLPQPLTLAEVTAMAAAGVPLCRNPASRFAFTATAKGDVLLFVDGQCFDCAAAAADFARALCAQDSPPLPAEMSRPGACAELLLALCNQGSVAFDEED
ncbi:JmjC domain-containing protein [Novosphingobium sp.]|uniref:JmjC domain-containing protein n=1 Tax=Novosphingobium sp. TaxID=1874826 RepID=UPI0035B404D6